MFQLVTVAEAKNEKWASTEETFYLIYSVLP